MVTLRHCARCGRMHKGILEYPLHGHINYTHWVICLNPWQPVLIKRYKPGSGVHNDMLQE